MVDWGLGISVIQWVEADDASKNPIMHRTVPPTAMPAQTSELPRFRNLDLEKVLIKSKKKT